VFKGWNASIADVRSYRKLPRAARTYLETLQSLLDTKIWMVSVGARRDQTLFMR